MIPTKSSWPFHPILVQLAGVIDASPIKGREVLITKTVERCFRLGAKLARHYGMPGTAVLGTFFGALAQDGGDGCEEALKSFAASIAKGAVESFKASESYQEFVVVQKSLEVVTSKGGDA